MSRDLKVVSAAMLTWGLGEGMFYIFPAAIYSTIWR